MKALITGTLIAMGIATGAQACSCVEFASAADQLAEADAMIVAKAGWTRSIGSRARPDWKATKFTVTRVLKTAPFTGQKRLTIEHGEESSMCGVRFVPLKTYSLLIWRGPDGKLATSSCEALQFPLQQYERKLGPP